jgi:hypothetical protein
MHDDDLIATLKLGRKTDMEELLHEGHVYEPAVLFPDA